MKKSGRKILSVILTAVMVFALLPVFGTPMIVEAAPIDYYYHTHEYSDTGKVALHVFHIGWSKITSEEDLKNLLLYGGNGYLLNDITIDAYYGYYKVGKEINLCLNGHSITQKRPVACITIENGGTLNLYDVINNDGSLTHDEGVQGPGIYMKGGTLNMYGGKISNNYDDLYGAGINQAGGTVNMYGGEIYKNTASQGGGVSISGDGTFNLCGGIISENKANRGAGIFVIDEIANISGGYIYDSIYYFSGKTGYSVTFDANGGTGNMPTQYVPGNTDMPIGKNQFTNSGKVFVEWNTEKDGSGTSYADEGKINIDKDTTLYAQWIDPNVNTYRVTFKVKNGTWNDGTTNDKVIFLKRNAGEIKLFRVNSSLIPEVGNKPDFTYKAGKWDGSFKKVISDNTTFTYSYEFDSSFKQLEISFDENYESSNIIKGTTGYDHKFTELPPPSSSREGYDFEGWYTDKEDGTKITTETVFDSETTVYAHWKAHNYTVVFDANGGSGNMDNQKREYDSTEPLTKNTFTKDGNTFMGWNTDKNGSGDSYSDKAIANLTSEDGVEITLYAMWEPNAYNVTLNEGKGTINTGNITGYTYGVGATLPTASDMTLTGYTFEGWHDNAGLTGTAITEISTTDFDDKEFYANWTPNPYTVVFDANGGSGTMLNMDRIYDDGSALTENVFSFEAHSFNGWNTESDGTGTAYKDEYVGDLSSTAGEVVTLYAQWDDVVYTINATNDGNGTATVSDDTGIKGTNITVTAIPNDGYKFAGWEVISGSVSLTDAKSSSTTFTLGAENAVVKATFEEIPKEPQSGSMEPTKPGTPEEFRTPEEPTEPGTPEEFKTPEEPTEPGTEDMKDIEPDPEIPEKDWLDDLRLQLRIADELGGQRTVTYSGDFALSYDIMQYLVEHPDITLIYTVTYEGVEYTITIPGGSAIADPNIPWYGPLWLLANYGGDNVPEVLAGSGKYTVVTGDTLSGIAAKFNTTVEELARKNGIENPNYIIVGQVIVY